LKNKFAAIALLLITSLSASSQTLVHPGAGKLPKRSLWKASVAAIVAATVADASSSVGRRELNPVLAGPNGQFGMRGIALKGVITGGALGMQYLFLRKGNGGDKAAAIANFGMASVYMSAALHNRTNRRMR